MCYLILTVQRYGGHFNCASKKQILTKTLTFVKI
nr:MAG TPA: hypothetical protein [Caudoviricetes sp.]